MKLQPHIEHVERAGFSAALATLRDVLRDVSFVAFDTELSGLSTQLEKGSLMDSVEQRYAQMRESAQSFAIVQFGLSCFTWRADAHAFDVRTFQFPIFPVLPSGTNGHHRSEMPDRSFRMQAKCLTFLREHGFDLNAWVDRGITYLSHDEQKQLAHVLQRPVREDVTAKFRGDPATSIRTSENERFLTEMRRRIVVLTGLALPSTEREDGFTGVDADEAAASFLNETISVVRPVLHRDSTGVTWRTFVTEPQAPFRRSALITLVEKEYPLVLVLDCPPDNDGDPEVKASPWKRRLRVIAVTSSGEKNTLQEAHSKLIKREHDERNLSLVGFTSVLDLLMGAGRNVSIVGHNMLLDIMQCYDKFHGPLPDSCSLFLYKLHNWLGEATIFDTKVLIEYAMEHIDVFGERLEHSALGYVYDCVSKEPFHGPEVRASTSQPTSTASECGSVGAHQAGYDAFMTGVVFLRVCSGLGVPNEAIAALGSLTENQDNEPKWQATMLQLQNSIKMGQILPSVALTLPGPYPDEVDKPNRVQFVRVDLTRAWLPKLKVHHIQQCVAWALSIRSPKLVKVRYESKSRVFVQLSSGEQVDELFKIREDCKEIQGCDRNPLPSLGCVDLSRVDDTSMKSPSSQDIREPNAKRQKLETGECSR